MCKKLMCQVEEALMCSITIQSWMAAQHAHELLCSVTGLKAAHRCSCDCDSWEAARHMNHRTPAGVLGDTGGFRAHPHIVWSA